jgi:hypothetical protein
MDYKKMYYEEVGKIKDKGILCFTLAALANADNKFWTSPCSSSGRFHPLEDNGECGLLRHLIKASGVVENFARKVMFNDYELDMARAAALMHDICKDGNPWGTFTDYRHGIIASDFLEQFYLENRTVKQIIKDAVRYHMSPWNTSLSPEKYFLLNAKGGSSKEGVVITPEDIKAELEEVKRGLMPHSAIETCVQEADYWASRSNMSFFPGFSIKLEERHDSA